MKSRGQCCLSAFLSERIMKGVTLLAVTLLYLPLALSKTTSIKIPGFVSPVVIVRDDAGIPHIHAAQELLGYAGLCWAFAEDRLFQMDLLRRAAQGRLAEIFGAGPDNSVLQQDKVARAMGLPISAAAHFSASSMEVRAKLQACAAGINDFMSFAKEEGRLPLELGILGYEPDPWKPEDSLLMIEFVVSGFDQTYIFTKIIRAALFAIFGPNIASALVPDVPENPSMFDANGHLNPPTDFLGSSFSPKSIPDHKIHLKLPRFNKRLIKENWGSFLPNHTFLSQLRLSGLLGSNNFSVDGSRTITGKPIIANDLHVPQAMPSLLYLADLHVAGLYRVKGVTGAPGFPGFISGNNGNIGWGITLAVIDGADWYVETTRLLNGQEQAFVNGNWVPIVSREEIIQIKGSTPLSVRVRTTPHGPILSDVIPDLAPFGTLSFKNTISQPEWTVDGIFSLPAIKDTTLFREALRTEHIGLNYIFTDREGVHGNMGYQMAGLAPQRNIENSLFPVSGSDGHHEWSRFATPEELPHVMNPPSHFLATSNNRIVPTDYAPQGIPIYLSRYTVLPWRAQRSHRLLFDAGNFLDVKNLGTFQSDTQSVIAPQIAKSLVEALTRIGLSQGDPDAEASFLDLKNWDGNISADSRGAAVYEATIALLTRNVILSLLGPALYQGYSNALFIDRKIQALQGLLDHPRPPFFGATTPQDAPFARDMAVQTAFAQANAMLRDVFGPDHSSWSWGGLHNLIYNHPFAPFDPRFALPIFPGAGDSTTLNLGGFFLNLGLLALPAADLALRGGPRAAFVQDGIAASRTVWDPLRPEQSLGVLSTGISGDPTSPHWADHAVLWRVGQFFRLK